MRSQQPLANKRIAVTRARRQASPLARLIREQGGIPVFYPCIEIAPPADPTALDSCLRQLRACDWLAFSSGNAVWALVERARAIGVEPALLQARIATVGPATSAELRHQLGRAADFTPSVYSAENLARELPLEPGERILLPQSDLAGPAAADILQARGAEAATVAAYRTVVGQGGADLPSLIAAGDIDALTFASPSAVRFFRQRCPRAEALLLPAFCLGPMTAKAAVEHGFHRVITAPNISLRAMLSALGDSSGQRDNAP